MAIKRYTTEELIDICTDLFYDYVSASPTFYTAGAEEMCDINNPTPIDYIHSKYIEMIRELGERQGLYASEIARRIEMGDENCALLLEEQNDILSTEKTILLNMCMKSQKESYEKTGRIDYSRTAIRIPLNKKINSYYDDFLLDVLFYDDVCTLKGKYNEYKQLKTKEERIDFVKANTEITHMGLGILKKNSAELLACIGLLGKQNLRDQKVLEGHITLLPHKFSSFSDLRLSDLNEIKNNDLRQILQDKIDLDREDMKLLATKNIRGSEYKLLEYKNQKKDYYTSENIKELYIRYVCDSTGRVYYNLLDTHNLKLSKYFEGNKLETYLEAWWNITHLGASIDGKSVVAC